MMDNEIAEPGRELEVDRSDGFKFAVTLIVAFLTFSSGIYNYVENNPVNDLLYKLFKILFPLFSFTVLGLVIYIIVKGVSLEIDSFQDKRKLEDLSSLIYLSTFKVSLISTLVILIVNIFDLLSTKYVFSIKSDMLIYIEILLLIFILRCYLLKVLLIKNSLEKGFFWKNILNTEKVSEVTRDKFNSEKEHSSFITTYRYGKYFVPCCLYLVLNAFISEITGAKDVDYLSASIGILTVGLLAAPIRNIWIIIESNIFTGHFDKKPQADKILLRIMIIFLLIYFIGFFLSPHLLAGNIKIEMNNDPFVKNDQIPLQIINTGHNENIIVSLCKTNKEGKISILDSIEVHPIKNVNEVIFGKYLRSSSLDYGVYKININTTNLTQGYYEISASEASKERLSIPIAKKAYNSFYLDKT